MEPQYNYTPPKPVERYEPVPQEAPRKAPARPREKEFIPQDNYDERSDRNRIGRPTQPRLPSADDYAEDRHDHPRKLNKAPRVRDEYNDEYASQPWNKPVAKGVQPCPIPGRGSVCAHKVEAGETMSAIALHHFGTSSPKTVARIAAVNPGVHPDRIYIGQTIYLPCLACNPNTASEPERETPHYRRTQENRIPRNEAQYIPISAL